MVMQTTTRGGAAFTKPFAWSYSRMKNFEVCPKRTWHVDLLPKGNPNKVTEPQGEALLWGNYVHDQLAKRCGANKTPLPGDLKMYEPWALKVLGDGSGDVYVEQSMTLTENFAPAAGNFAPDVWYRAKVDFIRVVGDIALLVDWKTGKILEDSVQLALSAACVFAAFPQVRAVRCSFVWLAEDAESSETFLREDMPRMWRGIWPRIEALKEAHQLVNYPPKPSGMCKRWCAVTSCPYHGKGSQ
jgi:hypothetical protein